MNNNKSELTRVERVDFQIAPGIFIDFYRFPDGEKRIGVTGAAIACGHNSNYFRGLEKRSPKRFKALQEEGFEGGRKSGIVERSSIGGKGSSKSQTISQDDFIAFIQYSAFTCNKPEAVALTKGLMKVSLATLANKAFGEDGLTLEQIRAALCDKFAETLDWKKEDRLDAESIDNHQLFLSMD